MRIGTGYLRKSVVYVWEFVRVAFNTHYIHGFVLFVDSGSRIGGLSLNFQQCSFSHATDFHPDIFSSFQKM